MVKSASPPSRKAKDLCAAFLVGGAICAAAQLSCELLIKIPMSEDKSRLTVTVSLIFLTALLTGIGVFDKIAKFAGAGTLVPITGFANAMVSTAVEYKTEGQILGLGANMFKIAGPVLVFGITSSAVYGIIYWLITAL